jgi:thymidylate synthase (FAD)
MTVHNNTIPLLDRGYVRYIDHMGGDLSIVRAARVSHNADWRSGENEGSDKRLINYLWKNKHTTPFEAVTVTLEVKAPIFVFRQWHRHRTQSYNEMSARYTELPDEFYVPDIRYIGGQDPKNKQARNLDVVHSDEEVAYYKITCEQAFAAYHRLIAWQWPRELARMVLPFSTYSRMFATGNLLNWFRFVGLRNHSHAQREIDVYAKAVLQYLTMIAPHASQAFDEARDAPPV